MGEAALRDCLAMGLPCFNATDNYLWVVRRVYAEVACCACMGGGACLHQRHLLGSCDPNASGWVGTKGSAPYAPPCISMGLAEF